MLRKLQEWNEVRQEFELVFVDLLGGVIGGGVALIPAYFIYHHLQSVMGIPWMVALTFGALMALLEFSILNRFFDAYQYRRKYAERTTKGSVSPWVPFGAFCFYLLVVLFVNGVLAFFDTIPDSGQTLNAAMLELSSRWNESAYRVSRLVPALVRTVVIFFLSLLSVLGAIVVTIGHQQRLHMLSKHGGGAQSTQRTQSTAQPEKPLKSDSTGIREDMRLNKKQKMFLDLLRNDSSALNDVPGLADKLDVTRQTIYNYVDRFKGVYFRVLPTGKVFFIDRSESGERD